MKSTSFIRLATLEDAAQIQAIYAPSVLHTPASFEVEPPSVEEMRRRITATLNTCPWLVCEHNGAVIGYAYASAHRNRAAYQWSIDTAIYTDARFHRSGMGRALYGSLFALLRLQGFYNAYAGITLPNSASVGLHEAMGFQFVGIYEKVGYKDGVWHDTGWWQLKLQAHAENPAPAPINGGVKGSFGMAKRVKYGTFISQAQGIMWREENFHD